MATSIFQSLCPLISGVLSSNLWDNEYSRPVLTLLQRYSRGGRILCMMSDHCHFFALVERLNGAISLVVPSSTAFLFLLFLSFVAGG